MLIKFFSIKRKKRDSRPNNGEKRSFLLKQPGLPLNLRCSLIVFVPHCFDAVIHAKWNLIKYWALVPYWTCIYLFIFLHFLKMVWCYFGTFQKHNFEFFLIFIFIRKNKTLIPYFMFIPLHIICFLFSITFFFHFKLRVWNETLSGWIAGFGYLESCQCSTPVNGVKAQQLSLLQGLLGMC